MKIYDENVAQVGELQRPEPVESLGQWYEPVAYRNLQPGDFHLSHSGDIVLRTVTASENPYWIMQPVAVRPIARNNFYDKLFDYIKENFDVALLDSQMYEIYRIVQEMEARKHTGCCYMASEYKNYTPTTPQKGAQNEH